MKGWSCTHDGFCKLQDILLAKGEVNCAGCQLLLREYNFSFDALDVALANGDDDDDGDDPTKSQADDANARAEQQEGKGEEGKGEEGQGEGSKVNSSEAGYAFARSSSHKNSGSFVLFRVFYNLFDD